MMPSDTVKEIAAHQIKLSCELLDENDTFKRHIKEMEASIERQLGGIKEKLKLVKELGCWDAEFIRQHAGSRAEELLRLGEAE